MKSQNLKFKIGTFLAFTLLLAMFLVSLVWGMFLKKNVVDSEVARLENILDIVAENIRSGVAGKDADLFSTAVDILRHKRIQCFSLMTEDGLSMNEENAGCLPEKLLADVVNEILEKKTGITRYQGTSWALFTFSHKEVFVGKPLLDVNGQIVGVGVVGARLAPLYAKMRQNSQVVFFYIIINTIIFTGLGLLRMMQIVMKPIERLIALSKQYTPSSPNFFQDDTNNEFANLTHSLNNLFSRIREDNEKLRKTVALLESANRELERNKNEMVRTEKLAAIGRLSAGLAHEIGNPLGIIIGYVDLLKRNDLSGEERETFSQNSQFELDRIKTLIRQLLDFSRSESLPAQFVSVNDLVRRTIDFVVMEKTFSHYNIIRHLDAEKDMLRTHADSLRQVLLNCLLNAGDSLAEQTGSAGEIVIRTTNTIDNATGNLLQISIKDNGTGIADQHLKNVFDPFFTTKESGQGTGLGLFVCHTIIERLGGSLALHNNPSGEQGVEVVITLPLDDALPACNV